MGLARGVIGHQPELTHVACTEHEVQALASLFLLSDLFVSASTPSVFITYRVSFILSQTLVSSTINF